MKKNNVKQKIRMIQSTTSENEPPPLNSSETLQKSEVTTTQINDQELNMAQNRVMEDNLTGTSLNIPIFKCPLASCNYTTTNYRSLTIHAAIHSGTRQYKCPVEKCNFHALKRNKVLNHYADVHPSLTPISVNAIIPVEDIPPLQGESVCKYEGCKYHTKRSSDMKYHLKVHSGVKDYECQYKNCHFSAYRLSDLSYHKKLYHNNNSESTLSSSPINNNITTPTNISPSPPLSPSLVSSSSSSLNMNNGTKRKRNDDMIISNSIPIPLIQNQSESNNIQQQTSQVITIIPPSSSSTTATAPISISDINTTTTTTNPIQQVTTTTTINQQIGNNNNEIITTSSEVGGGGVTNTNTVSPTSSTDEPQRKRICCIKQSCPINGCPLIFDSYNHMLQHLYVHTGEKLYKCPVANCNFAGSRISSVREHSKSIHPTIPSVEPIKLSGPTQDVEGYYHCNECTEKYKNLIDYRVHLASHKGVFNCPIDGCTYTAIRKSLIQSHLIIHSNKTLSCEHQGCIFKTNNPRAYDKHIKTHQNELLSNSLISNIPLQSPFITTTTTTNGNNNNNNLSGTPQPPPILPPTAATTTNTISSSSSSSNTSSLLNTVLTKNPKDGLFHCIYDNCSYSTIRKCNMKRHFNSHKDSNYSYAPKNEYKCSEPNCHFTTLCSSLFYEHAKNFHGGANVPPENTKEICCSFPHCEFKTHTLKNLSRHKIRMHNYDAKYYKCSEGDCTKVLKSKPELNMHLENHRQKKMMVTSNT